MLNLLTAMAASHLTPQFDQICVRHDIILIYIPPHPTRLIQALDVGCFEVLNCVYMAA